MAEFCKNVPNWKATRDDYRLVFRFIDGLWREVSNNVPDFAHITLAEYLIMMDILVDDRCTFMRLQSDKWTLEYRAYDGSITINYLRQK